MTASIPAIAGTETLRLFASVSGQVLHNPDEKVGSLLAFISFHQAYHVGQTALSRRLIGKPGAIK